MGPKKLSCHCQLEPKVPRPRNAFILYRQKNYEAAAAAQSHPVSSCTISKVLGREWNELPARTKAEWMSLAEEEKRRYQQKYDKTRCSECGRRQTVVRSIEDGASGELFDSSPNDMSDIFAQTSCMDPLSDRTCEAPGYQDQATVEDALALSSVDSPATSLYGRNDLSYLVESQEAIWTLCALLLPIGNGSNPLRYYMIHVLGIMDTISQETVSFTLTGETIYRLAEYHDTVCINVAQKQKFLRSIHAYRYFAGHDEVLDAIESDGNGEFKGEQSDAVKKDILNFLDMLD